MNQEVINLYDEYTHKPLTRKNFISKLIKLTGSTAIAMSVLPLLENNYASAQTVTETDDDLIIKDVTYDGEGTSMKAYLALPKSKKKLGSVIVIHENRGLNPHIKDVARRIAKAGFIALAPDALSPFGGTPANEDEARDLFGKLNKQQNLQSFLKAISYLKSLNESNGKTGCMGFCWGGALSNQLAVNAPDLKTAVAYYGTQPAASDVHKIKAELLLHYGELDQRVNAGIPEFETALKAAGTKYELYIYKGANHAFNNDTSPSRYHEESAKLAWQRTISLFEKTLS